MRAIVIDGFYPDPDAIRRWALTNDYRSAGQYSYPGWQSLKALASESLTGRLARFIGRDLDVDEGKFTFGGFRMVTGKSGGLTKVHSDSAAHWAGMVYLTPDAPATTGTGFFRHLETGLTGPPTDRQARQLGFGDSHEFERVVIRRDCLLPSAWELVEWVAPVYNRLILFRGCELYHAPLGGIGNEPLTARLTHNFFFNEARDRGVVSRAEATYRLEAVS